MLDRTAQQSRSPTTRPLDHLAFDTRCRPHALATLTGRAATTVATALHATFAASRQ